MERIVLEVDDYLAKAWRNSSEKVRADYESKITEILLELKKEEFKKRLDELGETAEKNGMTEEKLNEILNGQDE